MKPPWRHHGEHSDLERRLRDERPRPSDDLVTRVTEQTGGERSTRRRMRLGLAYSVSGLVLAAVIALGGLASPVDTAERILSFDSTATKGADKGKPAKAQYEEKVTICHRPPGNPSNGQTLTLPRAGAEAHLRDHSLDRAGPC